MAVSLFFQLRRLPQTLTGCCPDWTARRPASCAVARWTRSLWWGTARRWRRSRCRPPPNRMGRRTGGAPAAPSSCPGSLRPEPPSSGRLAPPSAPPLPPLHPPTVAAASCARRPPGLGCRGAASVSQDLHRTLHPRWGCWSWGRRSGRSRIPWRMLFSRRPRAQSHRGSVGRQAPSHLSPARGSERRRPGPLESG